MVSVGTQTERFEKQTSTPLPSPVHSDDESSSVFMDEHGDVSWIPEEEMRSDLCDEKPLQESLPDLNAADKFIVSQLMSLFTICPACCEETQGQIEKQEGTFVKIKQVCAACGYQSFWQNQPMLHRNMPACNLLLSGAIHFSGCMRLYTIPTIVQAWQNEQAGVIRDLNKMRRLILSGDCRSDSPGHCAKYGTYSLIEDRINKVLDIQLSSEVPSSSWCELEGLKHSIRFLTEQHMQVSALITDRNRQVAKWVREELCPKGTSHFFDIWHIGKKWSLDIIPKKHRRRRGKRAGVIIRLKSYLRAGVPLSLCPLLSTTDYCHPAVRYLPVQSSRWLQYTLPVPQALQVSLGRPPSDQLSASRDGSKPC
ncbi:hypothetical protein G5714_005544 [Onychostoma macrolepis]|uniref:Uncharacterized protein n=1 Tax=Onychostoma macrolepis TaxID=369639 RepID=A0A7J6D1B4_9TELE|nr:hypothetical protein G5714_005544 [Onychostoma macrolepis]